MTILTPWADVISAATAYLSDIDPIMANAIVRVGPCTLTPNPNLFETLVDARSASHHRKYAICVTWWSMLPADNSTWSD